MSTASVAVAAAGTRVVPVIDLEGGTAAHAMRERYRGVIGPRELADLR
jgi:hypothetical protein